MAPDSPRARRALVVVSSGLVEEISPPEFGDVGLELGVSWRRWLDPESVERLDALDVDEVTLFQTADGITLGARKLSSEGDRFIVGDLWALLERAREGDRLFDVSLDLLAVAGLDGFFSRLSPSFEDVLGWSSDELYSRSFLDFVHPDDVEATLGAMDGLAGGDSVIGFENRYRTKDGQWRWLSWTSRYDEQTGKIYALARDITEERKLRTELGAAKEEAESASRAKSQFLASMSHELRTPLNAIIGYSEMLAEDAEEAGDEQRVSDLSRIQSAGRQLLSLINQVLDLSKVEAGTIELFYERCDLGELLITAAQTVEPQVRASGSQLTTSLEERVIADTDRMKLRQVILNLLSNAAKFTVNGEISISLRRDQDSAIIMIRDTGVGMSSEDIARVFIPFRQGRAALISSSHGGTGLGLSIAARFLELLGGSMELRSEEGVGTEFELNVPLRRPIGGRVQTVTGGTLVILEGNGDAPLAPVRVPDV